MSINVCENCGGTTEVADDAKYYICDYCGVKHEIKREEDEFDALKRKAKGCVSSFFKAADDFFSSIDDHI